MDSELLKGQKITNDRSLYLQRMVLLQYFPQLSPLFVLGLGKVDPPGMNPNQALGLPQKPTGTESS